jgi:hypothetical protein
MTYLSVEATIRTVITVFYILRSVRPEPRTGLDCILAVRPEGIFGRTAPK